MTFTTLLQNRATGEEIRVEIPALQLRTRLQSPCFHLTSPVVVIGRTIPVFERIEVQLAPLQCKRKLKTPSFRLSQNIRASIPSLRATHRLYPLQCAIRYDKKREEDEFDLIMGLLQ